MVFLGFPGVSVAKNPPANARDMGLTSGSGRSPGEGNGNPLHYSYLENPMDRSYSLQGHKDLDMTKHEQEQI